MNLEQHHLREITRRHFFANTGVGLGSVGLASLLAKDSLLAAPAVSSSGDAARVTNPMAPRDGHFPAQAKQVIHLFMAAAATAHQQPTRE